MTRAWDWVVGGNGGPEEAIVAPRFPVCVAEWMKRAATHTESSGGGEVGPEDVGLVHAGFRASLGMWGFLVRSTQNCTVLEFKGTSPQHLCPWIRTHLQRGAVRRREVGVCTEWGSSKNGQGGTAGTGLGAIGRSVVTFQGGFYGNRGKLQFGGEGGPGSWKFGSE